MASLICYLETIPYEIREKIFSWIPRTIDYRGWGSTSYFKWKHVLPPILIALRPMPRAYSHALERFAKENEHLYLDGWTGINLTIWRTCELEVVKTMHLELSGIFHTLRGKDRTEKFRKPIWFTDKVRKMVNLREVNLTFNLDDEEFPVNNADRCCWLTEWPFWIEGCVSLSSLSVEVVLDVRLEIRRQRDKIVLGMMRRYHKKIGVMGQMSRVKSYYNYSSFDQRHDKVEIWQWKTDHEQQLMDWSRNMGVVWQGVKPRISNWNFFDDGKRGRLEERDGVFYIEDLNEYRFSSFKSSRGLSRHPSARH